MRWDGIGHRHPTFDNVRFEDNLDVKGRRRKYSSNMLHEVIPQKLADKAI